MDDDGRQRSMDEGNGPGRERWWMEVESHYTDAELKELEAEVEAEQRFASLKNAERMLGTDYGIFFDKDFDDDYEDWPRLLVTNARLTHELQHLLLRRSDGHISGHHRGSGGNPPTVQSIAHFRGNRDQRHCLTI